MKYILTLIFQILISININAKSCDLRSLPLQSIPNATCLSFEKTPNACEWGLTDFDFFYKATHGLILYNAEVVADNFCLTNSYLPTGKGKDREINQENEADALRHFLMSATLSYKSNDAAESLMARKFTAHHETGKYKEFANKGQYESHIMDFANNQIGHRFGEALKKSNKNLSDLELKKALIQKFLELLCKSSKITDPNDPNFFNKALENSKNDRLTFQIHTDNACNFEKMNIDICARKGGIVNQKKVDRLFNKFFPKEL